MSLSSRVIVIFFSYFSEGQAILLSREEHQRYRCKTTKDYQLIQIGHIPGHIKLSEEFTLTISELLISYGIKIQSV